jgi:hypothetical protein
MARTAVTITDLASNSTTNLPTGTSADPTNGHSIAGAFTKAGKLLLYVDHTTVSGKTLTLKAGTNPPASLGSKGDVTITLTASTKQFIGPLEAAQFAQSDGSLNFDLAASTTGTIYAIRMLRDV